MSDFDITTARRKLSKEARKVLELADTLGYRLDWASQKQQAIAMTSTHDERKLLLPLTSVNANRLRSLTTQLIRHAGTETVKEAADLTRIADRNRRAGKISPTFDIASGTEVTPLREDDLMPPAIERAMNEARLRQREEAEMRARAAELVAQAEDERIIRDANDDDAQVLELVAAERNPVSRTRDGDPSVHLVSETPWMVRKGGHEGAGGRMYESHSVIKQVWSDGGEDYRCRFCAYVNDNPRGVAGHAARTKVGHPAQAEVEIHRVNEYQPSEIKHPQSGVRRLTSELTHALDGIPDWALMDPDELAQALAEHVYAMRPDREPAQPLTPEQILHRITLMVDTGRLAEMHQQVESTAAALREKEAEAEALSVHAAELEAQVTTLRDERRALRDMLTIEDEA
jgi:hypothetical protein